MFDLKSIPVDELSEAEALALADLQSPGTYHRFLDQLTTEQLQALEFDWGFWGRPDQQWPTDTELQANGLTDWSILLLSAGRGSGKTLCGAQLTRQWAKENSNSWGALVAPTAADARDVMIQGPTGLVNICPPTERPNYEPTKKRLTFPNGTILLVYSAAEPDDLRGGNPGFAWCDELAKWEHLQESWDNLRLAMRGATHPRTLITTTPKPLPLFKSLIDGEYPNTLIRRFSTFRNAANLPDDFLNELIRMYDGTRLGRQELYADLLTDIEGALWNWDMIDEACKVITAPLNFRRVVVGVDPSGSATGDECGIVVAGEGEDGRYYLITDLSMRSSPDDWAKKVVSAYHTYRANSIIAEKNFGGDIVKSLLRSVDLSIPVQMVQASRGKYQRAEPISALYEQNRVRHLERSPDLENEMTSFVPGDNVSPNRLDALVWALTDLAIIHGTGNVGITSPANYPILPANSGTGRLIRSWSITPALTAQPHQVPPGVVWK